MSATTTGSRRHELAYDLETGVGWALGALLVLFARPFVWLVFHDWNDQHPRKTLKKLRHTSRRKPSVLHVPDEVQKRST